MTMHADDFIIIALMFAFGFLAIVLMAALDRLGDWWDERQKGRR